MRRHVIGCTAPLRVGGAKGYGWYHRALEKMNAPKVAIQPYDYAVPTPGQSRPQVFFKVQVGNTEPEKFIVEVAKDIVPKTAENFLKLCSGEHSVGYTNTPFHVIQKNQFIAGGDIPHGNGTGVTSIYGGYFEDENFSLRFTEPGVVGMANAGVNTNGSQFFITIQPMPHLNGRNVAFGKIVQGIDIVRKIENVYCVKGKPLTDVRVVECGLV
jgi:cyclophilin family peptidyl-prolyl cis-trans isomerase